MGNETRLSILLALWEAYEPFVEGTWNPTEGNAVTFSELRERIGVPDSGQFNYHLGKLEGVFVEQTADGYQLLYAGNKIVRTLVEIAGFEDISLEPTEIDIACRYYGAPTAITYQNQLLYHVCTACDGPFTLGDKHPSGVLAAWSVVNPASLNQREPEMIYTAARTESRHRFVMQAAGICPSCSGQVEPTLQVCDDHDPGSDGPCPACGRRPECMSRFVCTVCKDPSQTSVRRLGIRHSAAISFYWERGIDLRANTSEAMTSIQNIIERADQDLISRELPRVRVTFRHEDDELQLTYDEELNVIDVTEPD